MNHTRSHADRPAAEPRVRVWDAPVRLFHWLFVLAFAGAWLSIGDRWLFYHVFAGYAFASLWLFRIVWGFAGEEHARWQSFACRPRTALRYVRALGRGRAQRHLGHNPAGGWAVFGLVLLSGLLALSGLLTLGGQEQAGPLAGRLGFAAGAFARDAHEVLAWALLAMVVLHLLGVAFESLAHRENLPLAMLSGRKRAGSAVGPTRLRAGVAAAMLLALAAGSGVYLLAPLAAPAGEPFRPYTGPRLARNATWRNECGSCHLAYHPNLLPARSWAKLMAQQHAHFGEDLYLDADTVAIVRAFLVGNAADALATEAAWYMSAETSRAAAPLRITKTAYWRRKHADIDPRYWTSKAVAGKADCAACHLDATAGTFRDGAMRLPRLEPVSAAAAPPLVPNR